jgi:hypothetical protein
MGVKFQALQMIFEVVKTLNQCIYLLSLKTKTGFLMFKPYIFTLFTSISHILLIFRSSDDFCDITCAKKGLKNIFNVQGLLTNVEKIIKLYLQRFFTFLSSLLY